MVFTSAVFLFLFLPIVLLLNLLLPRSWRNAFLLLVSLIFYAFGEGPLLWVLLASVAVNYLAGRALAGDFAGFPQGRARTVLFYAVIAANLGLLGWFKYANFFVQEILLFPAGSWNAIALPIGISFFTFQCISYVIDVRRGDVPASRSLVDFGCYVTCFPQLIAGPIVRYSDIARELAQRHVSLDDFSAGAQRFMAGFCKKMLLANPMGRVSDAIYAMPMQNLDAPHAWLAMICYTLQIYYDFSGYSDMAIGMGRMLGFTFPENFNFPYIARSIRDFWRRWHMTLSTWLRDYLYIPLGGSRCSQGRVMVNLWLVFLLCGLWHGAQWSFMIWGAWHGFFLVLERTPFGRLVDAAPRPVQHLYTLLAVVVGWVIFRADTLTQASGVLLAAAGLGEAAPYPFTIGRLLTPDIVLVAVAGMLWAMPLSTLLPAAVLQKAQRFTSCISGIALLPLFLVALACLSADTYNPFLYFRF